jgi:hypothetical protein
LLVRVQPGEPLSGVWFQIGSKSKSIRFTCRFSSARDIHFDAGNQRAEALQQYNAALALDCADNLEREARDYRRRPYKG